METIKINDMQTKGVVFIVKYDVNGGGDHREATLNTNFNKQEIWYLENEVGIGGTVSVLISPSRCGRYINIKAVDMKSAVKGNVHKVVDEIEVSNFVISPKSDRDKSIIAQCLTKIFLRNMVLLEKEPKVVLDAYNYFLGELQ